MQPLVRSWLCTGACPGDPNQEGRAGDRLSPGWPIAGEFHQGGPDRGCVRGELKHIPGTRPGGAHSASREHSLALGF